MVFDVTVGLDPIANNANLTFIFFIAFVLQAMISVRFGYYAALNRRASDVTTQNALWRVLVGVGVTGGIYALFGILDVVTSISTPYRDAVLLAHVTLLAMALRTLHHQAIPVTEDGERATRRTQDRRLWLLGLLAFVAVTVATVRFGEGTILFGLETVTAMAFVAVGVAAGVAATTKSRVQGTVVDTLLRHLLPVLLFAAFVPLLTFATFAGLPLEIVLHVQVVFVIMAATALMTATIKLRQNLAGL